MPQSYLHADMFDDFPLTKESEELLTFMECQHKVLRVNVDLEHLDFDAVAAYFQSYQGLENDPSRRKGALEDFLIGEFISIVKDKLPEFRVSQINGKPTETELIGDYLYLYVADGTSIQVCVPDRSHHVTYINKLMRVGKTFIDAETFLFSPLKFTGRHGTKRRATRNLLGITQGEMTTVLYSTRDDLDNALANRNRNPVPICRWLHRNNTSNLSLVFSATSQEMKDVGAEIHKIAFR